MACIPGEVTDCCGMWSHMATKSTSTSTVRRLTQPAGRQLLAVNHMSRGPRTPPLDNQRSSQDMIYGGQLNLIDADVGMLCDFLAKV